MSALPTRDEGALKERVPSWTKAHSCICRPLTQQLTGYVHWERPVFKIYLLIPWAGFIQVLNWEKGLSFIIWHISYYVMAKKCTTFLYRRQSPYISFHWWYDCNLSLMSVKKITATSTRDTLSTGLKTATDLRPCASTSKRLKLFFSFFFSFLMFFKDIFV